MKVQNKQEKWRKWISKVLLLTLLATMVPANEAKAVDVEAVGGSILGDAEWEDGKICFPNANVSQLSLEDDVRTVLVSVTGGGSISGWNTAPTIKDKGGRNTCAWVLPSGTTDTTVNTLLQSLTFNYEEGMTIKVVVDSGASVLADPANSYITEYNGNYYMYVPNSISWTAAYTEAKGYTFMGMPGYLTAIADQDEAKVLKDISPDGYAGWTGGTLLINNPTTDANGCSMISTTGGLDNVGICKCTTHKVRREADGTGTGLISMTNSGLYYWACGPEKGYRVENIFDSGAEVLLWGDTQPDFVINDGENTAETMQEYDSCVIATSPEAADAGKEVVLKDIKEDGEGVATGYFVEFGDGEVHNTRYTEEKEDLRFVKVTANVTGGTFKGANAATKYDKENNVGDDYIASIEADTNFKLPDKISVKVNGKELTEDNYIWRSGTLRILGEFVTGNIEISVQCTEIKSAYSVSYNLIGATSTGKTTATAGTNFSAVIKANNDRVLPGSITVKAGTKELAAGTDYTWDAVAGKLTIKGKCVTADIEISVTCIAKGESYSVTIDVEDGTCDGADTAKSGENYTATVKAKTRHKLPDSITVRVGGTKLKEGTSYKWDEEAGKITVYGKAINADVAIDVECPKKGAYSVTHSVSGGTYTGSANVEEGTAYSSTIKADEGYTLPNIITVTVGGDELKEGIDYTWSATGGKVSIPAESVTGDIEITVGCSLKAATYTVSCTVNNGTCTDAGSANSGKDYALTITANAGYRLPDAVVVKAGTKELTVGTDYTWDKATGKLTIKGASVTGNITITVDCIEGEAQSSAAAAGNAANASGNGDTPQTGDANNLLIYVLIMTLGVGGIVGSIVYKTLKEY